MWTVITTDLFNEWLEQQDELHLSTLGDQSDG